jgi:4'-phosphopantetheinyl transferase
MRRNAPKPAPAGSSHVRGPKTWSIADLRSLDRISVGPGEVLYAFLSLEGPAWVEEEALLDDGELERSRRFIRSADRRRFVLAHAALRLLLARARSVDPAALNYACGPNGKPRLVDGCDSLEFNLSHSHELGLVAVARDRAVGVDVERVRDVPDALEIADLQFGPRESRSHRSLPAAERREAFFRCWTRKEAMVKASGEGLTQPLDSFEVDLEPGSLSALRRNGGQSGGEARWSLRELPAPPGHVAAGAVASMRGGPVPWRALSQEAQGHGRGSDCGLVEPPVRVLG